MAAATAFGEAPAPEIPTGLEWLNSGRDLTMADLRGRLLIFHFWTYA